MTAVIILAAGKGTRMKGDRPKVLTDFAGEPIIARVLRTVRSVSAHPVMVVGHGADAVRAAVGPACTFVEQQEQLGTGHAVAAAEVACRELGAREVVVLNGDHPLVSAKTIRELVAAHLASPGPVTIATITVPSYDGDWRIFYGYGRVIRNADGSIARVVELKSANEEERAVREVNCGYYCFDADWLWKNIGNLENDNTAKEYYVTDMVGIARAAGERVKAYVISDPAEGMGVNTPEELEIAGRHAVEGL